MAMKAKFLGRDAAMRKLNRLVPEAEKEMATAQLDGAKEVAARIAARAPVGDSGEYARSIEGDRLANRPGMNAIGQGIRNGTKDKNATGVFAHFIWRFLEFGTAERTVKKTGQNVGRMTPQPHVFPTFRAYRKQARRKVANAVNKAVRKVKNG